MDAHIREEEIVFGDPHAKKDRYLGLWSAGAAFLGALVVGVLDIVLPVPHAGVFWPTLLSIGTAFMFWELHVRFMRGGQSGRTSAVVIDRTGIRLIEHGAALAGHDRMGAHSFSTRGRSSAGSEVRTGRPPIA